MTVDREDEARYDVVVVGAGLSGLYVLKKLREAGLRAVVFEAGSDVGGTWYWNSYPGARCDVATLDYTYSFDPGLEDAWHWSEKYATQPEIERYIQFVADRYDLRRDIRFETRVSAATWDGNRSVWLVETDGGDALSASFVVMATGCLSVPKEPDLPGLDRFAGNVCRTGTWPRQPVSFEGSRVAVIGTGSSGVQAIPVIASQAKELAVLQRTPSFVLPSKLSLPIADRQQWLEADRSGYREAARHSRGGTPVTPATDSFADLTTEQIRERFEQAWEAGELYSILAICSDLMQNREANDVVVGLIHEKIRAIVADPDTANSLCPSDYPFGTRRPCLGTDYYETYNRPNVRLIDLRKHPLEAITEHGIAVVGEQLDIDTLVLATGFDAMTGALLAIEVTGRDGLSLAEAWHGGPSTYLGLMTAGFPNLFMVTGPGSPSVLSNMAMSIQHDVEWIAETLQRLAAHGWVTLEATRPAQEAWVRHVNAVATPTLYPTANSWYTGANVPGKPRVFMPYLGGHGNYREICAEVRDRDFLGFTRTSPSGTVTNGGIIRDAPAAEPGSIFAIAFEE